MDQQIKAEFESSGFKLDDDEQILDKCLSYCINYNLSPSDLVSHWEIYYLNRQLTDWKVETAHMNGFLSYLRKEMMEKVTKEEPHLHVYSSDDVEMLLGEDNNTDMGILDDPCNQYERLGMDSHDTAATPGTNRNVSSSKDPKDINIRITPFGQRINKFTSQFLFNYQNTDNSLTSQELENMEDDVIRRVQPTKRCNLQVHCLQPESGCRFMYDRTEDQFNYLAKRIMKHAHAFTASGLYGEPTDATFASQKNILAVGMVCCDGEGHINEKSILLQGSIEHSGGQRVRLDLQKLPYFSFFPGQVIGVDGHNPSGHCLIASKVFDFVPNPPDVDCPPAKKLATDLDHQTSSSESRVLSQLIAAGPFTTTDNLLFEPLTELLAYASRRQPQLIILMGPFIDSDHPEIKKGTIDREFDEIFRVEIIQKLEDYAKFMGSTAHVILLPSIRDAHHDFVFPQPAFDIHLTDDIKPQITCLPNPCFFSANEITISCCTVDILKQLSSEEISRTPTDTVSGDRMARLATHILRQQSFYPLYPPALGVPVDFSLAIEALEIPRTPDVLILPSDLAPFVKLSRKGSDGEAECLCINPGRLAKGFGGGSFVELRYNRDSDGTSATIIRI